LRKQRRHGGALRVFPGRVGVDLMEFFGIKIYAEKVRKKIRQTVINYLISSLVIKKKKTQVKNY